MKLLVEPTHYLRESKMPCVIIELCDIGDISMLKYIRTNCDEISQSIATGIKNIIDSRRVYSKQTWLIKHLL
jgi:hypothetical protein